MEKSFWKLASEKLVENLLSVKVWIIFSFLFSTAFLCWYGKIDGDTFAAVNGAVISTVLAIREGIKVAKIKALENKDEVKDIKV